jgi:hypothetical protein
VPLQRERARKQQHRQEGGEQQVGLDVLRGVGALLGPGPSSHSKVGTGKSACLHERTCSPAADTRYKTIH